MKKILMLLSLVLCSSLTDFCHAEAYEDLTNRGLYIDLSGGILFDNNKYNYIKTYPGSYLGSSMGYKFCNSISVEGEFIYQRHLYHYPYGPAAHINIFTYMGNVFYTFDFIKFPFKPYLGMGMGYANAKGKETSGTTMFKRDGVAWQAIAGISYPVCQKTELSLEYRFFQVDTLKNNKVGLALNRYF